MQNLASILNGLRPAEPRHASWNWLCGESRPARVRLLLAGIVALSLVDLVMTLHYMTTIGMSEANPIVRNLIALTGGSGVIVLYKSLTVAIAIGLLNKLNCSLHGEIGAWIGLAVLCVLTIQWVMYASFMSSIEPEILAQLAALDANWVQIR